MKMEKNLKTWGSRIERKGISERGDSELKDGSFEKQNGEELKTTRRPKLDGKGKPLKDQTFLLKMTIHIALVC